MMNNTLTEEIATASPFTLEQLQYLKQLMEGLSDGEQICAAGNGFTDLWMVIVQVNGEVYQKVVDRYGREWTRFHVDDDNIRNYV
jgi:hypothetical protein